MSAIFGCVSFSDAKVSRESFDTAFSTLNSWGKDGRGVLQKNCVIFGHQNLALRKAALSDVQPYEKGDFFIVADAVIDNRVELCSKLNLPVAAANSVPDSQLILMAFIRWGEECPKYLLGDFAFAIWNSREGKLFAARDAMGVRPFFYTERNKSVFFSTTVEAISAVPSIDFEVDEYRVASFLAQPLLSHEDPFIKGVEFLSPGHSVCFSSRGMKINRYWFPESIQQSVPQSLEGYAEKLRELMQKSVEDRLVLDHPVGSHISGGLDSTGVTVLAHRTLRQYGGKLDMAYTWAPPINNEFPLAQEGFDERTEIAELSKREGFDFKFGTANKNDYLKFFKRNLAFENSSDLFEELPLMEDAASRGTRVMLSGWGADECVTFGTRGYPSWLLSNRRFMDLFNMARCVGGGLRNPWGVTKFLVKDAIIPFLPGPLGAKLSSYQNVEKLQCLGDYYFMKQHPDVWKKTSLVLRKEKDPFTMQCNLLINGHIAARMSLWSTWAGPLGLQYRYPFMDKRLLEFSLSLPPDMLWQRRSSRVVYREAMSDVLPRRVSKRDIANENKRNKVRLDCWQALKDRSEEYEDIECPWLDMKRFSKKLREAPSSLESFDLLSFIPLHSCMRVLELWNKAR